MSNVNHFAISRILNSEIAGTGAFGHGALNSMGDGQRFVDLRNSAAPFDGAPADSVDDDKVTGAFLAVRDATGDRGSVDLYVADPARNARFLDECRRRGMTAGDFALNKKLFALRKTKRLSGLRSKKTVIDFEDFAFAGEFAAAELKYKNGASVDDIVCDPSMAKQFDEIAAKVAPGRSPFEYRWALLNIRKAGGRKIRWKSNYKMPRFAARFRLLDDSLETLPDDSGAYLLFEKSTNRPLYARSVKDLRHSIELHRNVRFMNAILDKLWEPDPSDFLVSYARIPDISMLKPIERRIIEDKKPLFNVAYAA